MILSTDQAVEAIARRGAAPDEGDGDDDPILASSMSELGWDKSTRALLRGSLARAGVAFSDLLAVSRGCDGVQIARMLREDFGVEPALRAHQLRATVVHALTATTTTMGAHQSSRTDYTKRLNQEAKPSKEEVPVQLVVQTRAKTFGEADTTARSLPHAIDRNEMNGQRTETPTSHETQAKRPSMKSVHVNNAAAQRKQSQQRDYEYGLNSSFPALMAEMDQFYTFMTRPSPYSQEEPIRPATASVYLRHAKLYLGWLLRRSDPAPEFASVSLLSIFPSSDKAAAAQLIDFVLWLRTERCISNSYEANVLRGLTKLVKFRFARESEPTSSYSSSSTQTYHDVPLVVELRRLHRVANRQQKLSPRSSNEQLKWISWPEYLQVVESYQRRARTLLDAYHAKESPCKPNVGRGSVRPPEGTIAKQPRSRHQRDRPICFDSKETVSDPLDVEDSEWVSYSSRQREIAIALQRYLVLAIFASVPDRQRTIRELEVGKTLVMDEATGCYCIRHAPQDYKTGKTYGERPPLQLPVSLTEGIDRFLNEWRPCLRPTTNVLFVQPRTGNPLSRDSVYQLVSRACFEQTGKRTNPHLLRDMIVTHVRDSSNASEKELEALALFMGHSLQMQRTSYDRRTLTRKIAPAVQLLSQVNSLATPIPPASGSSSIDEPL
jgi:hypothetical protein